MNLGHSGDVVLEGGHLLHGLGGVESQELGELGSVGGILVDTELQVLAESLVELVEGVLVFSNLGDHLKGLLDNVLPDDLQDLVLLKSLTRNVERKVLRVNDTLDEVEVLGDEVLAVVHDEDSSNVELDVVPLLLGLKEVERCSLGDEQDSLELELTLNREVLDSKVVFPVVAQTLVEGRVLFIGNVLGVSGPEGLGSVELLVLDLGLSDLLGLLGLVVVLDLLDLGRLVGILLGLLRVIGNLLLDLLGDNELDRVRDELGVLLDDLLDLLLLEVLELVLLQEQLHFGTTAQRLALGVGSNGEGTSGSRLPDVLLIVVVLGGNLDLLGDQVGRVETNTELSNHADIGTTAQSLHESLGSGLGDCSQVVDQVSLGHTNTRVSDGETLVLLVGSDSDEKLLFGVEDRGVGEGLVSDLVKGIGGVGL